MLTAGSILLERSTKHKDETDERIEYGNGSGVDCIRGGAWTGRSSTGGNGCTEAACDRSGSTRASPRGVAGVCDEPGTEYVALSRCDGGSAAGRRLAGAFSGREYGRRNDRELCS